MSPPSPPSSTVRLRMTRLAVPPVGILAICVIPVVAAAPWSAFLFALPVLAGLWVWRSGVDLDADGVVLRAAFGSRRVDWMQVAGVRVGARNQLWLVRTDGGSVRMPTLRAADLPRLFVASAGRLGTPPPTG